jgi:hypothetical protein
MSHHDAGHYAAKHAPEISVNPAIATAIISQSQQGKITCADAHRIAIELEVSPADVGKAIDLLEIRITHCQLGLFAKRETPATRERIEKFPPSLTTSLEAAQTEGRLSCREAWRIAKEQNLSKAMVGTACNTLQIKIVACQLGTF